MSVSILSLAAKHLIQDCGDKNIDTDTLVVVAEGTNNTVFVVFISPELLESRSDKGLYFISTLKNIFGNPEWTVTYKGPRGGTHTLVTYVVNHPSGILNYEELEERVKKELGLN